MIETTLSLALRKVFAGSAAVGAALMALPSHAQQDPAQPMQRVADAAMRLGQVPGPGSFDNSGHEHPPGGWYNRW